MMDIPASYFLGTMIVVFFSDDLGSIQWISLGRNLQAKNGSFLVPQVQELGPKMSDSVCNFFVHCTRN
jgi:hypothetical protein